MTYLSLLYPSSLRVIILNTTRSNSRVAGNSCSHLREICCVCFANKQTSYLILSGARLLISSSSSTPSTCLGSYSIALGPVWPSILCYFIAVAPIGLRAILLGWNLPVKKVDWVVESRVGVGSLCISA
jgi:hypothetical protein